MIKKKSNERARECVSETRDGEETEKHPFRERERLCVRVCDRERDRMRSTRFVPPCEHRKVDVRLPGKRHANSHGARPVHLTITTI